MCGDQLNPTLVKVLTLSAANNQIMFEASDIHYVGSIADEFISPEYSAKLQAQIDEMTNQNIVIRHFEIHTNRQFRHDTHADGAVYVYDDLSADLFCCLDVEAAAYKAAVEATYVLV